MHKTISKALSFLAGDPSSGERSSVADAIRDLLQKADWKNMRSEQLTYLENVLAGGLSYVKHLELSQFFQIGQWSSHRSSPVRDLQSAYWVDHATKLVSKGSKKTTWMSEPYRLDSEDIKHLAKLISRGWDIAITANMSSYCPGKTVAVLIRQYHPGPEDELE